MADSKPSPIKRSADARVQCTVTFTEEQRSTAEQSALQRLGKNVKLKGFRPGKAPAEMLRERIEPSELLEQTLRELLPDTFDRLMAEHQIKPIVPPKVEAVSREPLTVNIVFVEKPAVSVKNPTKIKVEKTPSKVEKKDVDRVVEYVLRQYQKTSPVDRPVEKADQVTMDFWGADAAGTEIPEIRSQDYKIIVGENTLIPGFEDNLVGKKIGEEIVFTVTFPEKYHAEKLQKQPVTFHVTLKQIEAVQRPTLDDAFAKETLQADSAETFRKNVEASLVKQEEDSDRGRREQELLEKIRLATTVSLAPELVEDEFRNMLDELRERLEKQGLGFQEWLQQAKKTTEEVEKDMRQRAAERLTLRMGVQQLIEDLTVIVSDDEMTTAIQEMTATLKEEERGMIAANYAKGQRAYEQMHWERRVQKLMEQLLG